MNNTDDKNSNSNGIQNQKFELNIVKFYINNFYYKISNKISKNFNFIFYEDDTLCKILNNNNYLNIPKKIIGNSNEKKIIRINLNREYIITHTDRKIAVFLLTMASLSIKYFMNPNTGLKLRIFVPYYIFFSMLFNREHLNPFITDI